MPDPKTRDSKPTLRELARRLDRIAHDWHLPEAPAVEGQVTLLGHNMAALAEAVADEVARIEKLAFLADRVGLERHIEADKRLAKIERRLGPMGTCGKRLCASESCGEHVGPNNTLLCDEHTETLLKYGLTACQPTTTDGGVDPNLDTPAKLAPQVAGGKARAASLSPERRTEIARNAANTRWGTTTDGSGGYCQAPRSDGECSWQSCPQLRDGEPRATGRGCPLKNPWLEEG